MTRYFNTEGCCKPDKHYMVCLDDRMAQIKKLYVDRGKYFVINRGRQYGKTTTLFMLKEYLKNDYIVIFMDFQKIGSEEFVNAEAFVCAFVKLFLASFAKAGVDSDEKDKLLNPLKNFVDNAVNNQVFIDFLVQLRGYYLDRENR